MLVSTLDRYSRSLEDLSRSLELEDLDCLRRVAPSRMKDAVNSDLLSGERRPHRIQVNSTCNDCRWGYLVFKNDSDCVYQSCWLINSCKMFTNTGAVRIISILVVSLSGQYTYTLISLHNNSFDGELNTVLFFLILRLATMHARLVWCFTCLP